MKPFVQITIVGTLSFAIASFLTFSFDPRRVTSCPYGHTELKKVEIVYSSPLLPRSDEKTLARIAKHEAFLAPYSDVGDPARLPKATVFCTKCEFVFLGNWTRDSGDPSSFTQPFSSLLKEFPLPDKSSLTYIQYTQDLEQALVVSERLDYKTTVSLAVLKAQVSRWAKAHGLTLVPPTLPEVPAHRPYPAAKLMTEQVQSWGYGDPGAPVTGHVDFVSYPEEGIVFIDLLITLPRSVKGSIDDALKERPSIRFEVRQ